MNFDSKLVKQDIDKIVAGSNKYNTPDVLKTIFSLIDLTSLKPTDSDVSIEKMVDKVNRFSEEHPNMPQVAAICVYPNFAETVKNKLQVPVNIASVSAAFPASQTFLSVKAAESELAVSKGANEIDIVISLGKFLNGELEEVANEIRIIKESVGDAHLKVILESGLIPDLNAVYEASVLSINAGADFIKTSTGKENPAATLEAVYVMCHAIKNHYEKTGKKIGLKPAGGISTTEEVIAYYAVVKHVLGEEWLNNKLFRIGASRLANNLLKDVYALEDNTEIEAYF